MFVFTAPSPLGPWKQQTAHGAGRNTSWGPDYGCDAGQTMPTPAAAHTLPLTAIPQPGQV